MKIGCFALQEPFTPMKRQFEAIKEMGIKYADVTDNHNGASLGVEYEFAASVSLACHPSKIKKMADDNGITLTTFCAHASLLDPASPDVYGTKQIIDAVRLAHLLGIKEVITTDGHMHTDFAKKMTQKERIFLIKEKLYTPIKWAEELGVELLLETHGIVTDDVKSMGDLLTELGHEKTVGICLDTGNSWLGGANPVDYVKTFGNRIRHVHWKDFGKDWEPKRGTMYGTGMSLIPLGTGVINVKEVFDGLKKMGYKKATTLEIAGRDNVLNSVKQLKAWGVKV
jgi:inosose dehydratase